MLIMIFLDEAMKYYIHYDTLHVYSFNDWLQIFYKIFEDRSNSLNLSCPKSFRHNYLNENRARKAWIITCITLFAYMTLYE